MRERLPRDVAWLVITSLIVVMLLSVDIGWGNDTRAYWGVWRGAMYTSGPMTGGAYLYSPVFAQLLWPVAQVPWHAFAVIFILGAAIGLAWLLKPLGFKWGIPLWLAGLPEIATGNIFIPLAVVAVIGFAWPEAWAFAALTKVSVCVGPVWFLVRGEWENLLRAVGFTIAIVVVSAGIDPGLWQDWVQLLLGHLGDSAQPLGSQVLPPLVVRFPVGIVFVVWGALTDRRWCVPIGMLLCSPVVWVGSLTLLAGIPRLRGESTPSPPA